MKQKVKYADYSREGFPWEAYAWVLKEYGHYLTISELSKALKINRGDMRKILNISGVEPYKMPGGSIKYRFLDIPKILEAYEQKEKMILSKAG